MIYVSSGITEFAARLGQLSPGKPLLTFFGPLPNHFRVFNSVAERYIYGDAGVQSQQRVSNYHVWEREDYATHGRTEAR